MRISFLFLLASLVVSSLTLSPSHSFAIPIDIYGGTYTTFVSTTTHTPMHTTDGQLIVTTETLARTWTSENPHGDSMQLGPVPGPFGVPTLIATTTAFADQFTVSAATGAHSIVSSSFAAASATSQTFFSPLVDGSATFGLQFTAQGQYNFTGASVNLFDHTLGQNLWSYGWTGHLTTPDSVVVLPPGNVPNIFGQIFTFDTLLHTSHQYELSMYAESDANSDSQGVTIALTGLGLKPVKVPEPSTLLLLGSGLVGLALWRRKQTA